MEAWKQAGSISFDIPNHFSDYNGGEPSPAVDGEKDKNSFGLNSSQHRKGSFKATG